MPLYGRPPDMAPQSGKHHSGRQMVQAQITSDQDNMLVQYRIIHGILKSDLIKLGLSLVKKLPAKVVKDLVQDLKRGH